MNTTEQVEVADSNATESQTQGNLSQEDLLGYLSGQTEGEASEPTEPSEGEQAEPEEVLSQSSEESEEETEEVDEVTDEADEPAEEETETQPKSVQKLLKQINRLTARAKTSEEQVEALTAQVESMNTQQKVQENPSINEAQDLQQLETLRKEALSAKKWARANEDQEYVEHEGKEYTRAEIKKIRDSAEEHLDELIPAREKFLQARTQSEQLAVRDFPFLSDKNAKEHDLLKNMLADPNLQALDQLPNGLYLRALMIEGVNAVKGRNSQSKTKPTTIKKTRPKPPPPTSPSSDVQPPLKKSTPDARKILGTENISESQLTAFLQQS